MDTPLFSIITITFNAATTLPPTLRSVEVQSYTNYEYIVIDGASRDNTVQLVEQSSLSVRLVSEPDKGLYDAMNKGLKDKLNTMENPATWPFIVFAEARANMKEVIREKLRTFGSAGRL